MGVFTTPSLFKPPLEDPITTITADVKRQISNCFDNENRIVCDMLMAYLSSNIKIHYLWAFYLELTTKNPSKEHLRASLGEMLQEIKAERRLYELKYGQARGKSKRCWGEKGKLTAYNWLLCTFEGNYLPLLK
jgi:hypothetical protein